MEGCGLDNEKYQQITFRMRSWLFYDQIVPIYHANMELLENLSDFLCII